MLQIPAKDLRSRILTAFAIAVAVWCGAALRDIARGSAVADQVTVRACWSVAPVGEELQVLQVTRNKAEIALSPVADGDCLIYRGDSWFSGVKFTAGAGAADLTSLTVAVGGREMDFSRKLSVPGSAEGVPAPGLVTARDIRSGTSLLPPFRNLMNWPGDWRVLARGLMAARLAFGLALLAALAAVLALTFLSRRADQTAAPVDAAGLERFLALQRLVSAASLSVISLALFMWHGPSAFDWPAMDMGPFFARHFDPTFASNDFFTDSSSQPNPRWIFGYAVIGLTRLFHTDWYTTVFFLKTFLVMATPAIIFLALSAQLDRKLKEHRLLAVAQAALWLFTAAVLWPAVVDGFAIALWKPIQLTPDAEAVALFFGFLAALLSTLGRNCAVWSWLGNAAWFVSVMFHPVKGLTVFVFYVLADADQRRWKDYARSALLGVLLPMAALVAAFPAKAPLSAADFVYHYIKENHVFHYFPSSFTSVGSIPWWVVFAGTAGTLAALSVFAWRRRSRDAALVAALFAAAYAGSVLLEWLFVELHPVKAMAVLGPVRFTALGYWMLAFAAAWMSALTLGHETAPILACGRWSVSRRGIQTVASVLALVWLAGSFATKDDPIGRIRTANPAFAAWVSAATRPGDVFVTDLPNLAHELPLAFGRAVFAGNGFPFREDDFVEFDRRKDEVYGSYAEWEKLPPESRGVYWTWTVEHYRSLEPADFRRIAELDRLDYVIIEKGRNKSFAGQVAAFDGGQFTVYRTSDIK